MLYAYKSEYALLALFLGSIGSKIASLSTNSNKKVSHYSDVAAITALFVFVHFLNHMNDKYAMYVLGLVYFYTLMSMLKIDDRTWYLSKDVIQIILLTVCLGIMHHPYLE